MNKSLKIMACPKCKGIIKKKDKFLICEHCKIVYSVENGVANMLIKEARRTSKALC